LRDGFLELGSVENVSSFWNFWGTDFFFCGQDVEAFFSGGQVATRGSTESLVALPKKQNRRSDEERRFGTVNNDFYQDHQEGCLKRCLS
jgi:hypothetical protein